MNRPKEIVPVTFSQLDLTFIIEAEMKTQALVDLPGEEIIFTGATMPRRWEFSKTPRRSCRYLI